MAELGLMYDVMFDELATPKPPGKLSLNRFCLLFCITEMEKLPQMSKQKARLKKWALPVPFQGLKAQKLPRKFSTTLYKPEF